jgi:protease II
MKRFKKERILRKNALKNDFLAEQGQKWYERLGKAFTDEDSAFNFPIKYPALDLDKRTKDTLLLTAGILAGGMIIGALIISRKK